MWDDATAMGRLTRWLMVLMVLLLIGTGVAWVYNSDHFPVKQVAIQGKLKYSDGKELQNIAQQYMRGNIFRADVHGAGEAFQKLAWTDSVLVRRRLPDTVEIILEERIPLARWQSGGLLDTKGNVFQAEVEENLPLFSGEPNTGKDMVRHYREFADILDSLGLTINKLIYTPRSAWQVVLDNGITVRLGRENETQRLRHFAEAWPALLEKQRDSLLYVDMRYKDGFSVRHKPTSDRPSE
ncbi:cell division protein FtsQ/DivIB [Neisseria animalis]|uniref:Cell division protein FtsQ n=1 Tax=Neisseria animalis TaxID=492 RepID=A0A5P3MQ57_NEIAN|nr:cell division protein FtsQ/DivIB [Neisseria animalis]QEY23684.1 cell division protein FtsQ [Neisseria animalis]ROW32828.1 FtsQ-type POTRA domain-containing protein [Neisseria animalis]VEE09482.1 protein FtsQ [Neisseria animalis]